jgi:hypothetical protein
MKLNTKKTNLKYGLSFLLHVLVWYAAQQVDHGEYLDKYVKLGDDVVIADAGIVWVYA